MRPQKCINRGNTELKLLPDQQPQALLSNHDNHLRHEAHHSLAPELLPLNLVSIPPLSASPRHLAMSTYLYISPGNGRASHSLGPATESAYPERRARRFENSEAEEASRAVEAELGSQGCGGR